MASKGKCMQLWNWETSQWGTGKRKRWENKGEDETLFNDILEKKKRKHSVSSGVQSFGKNVSTAITLPAIIFFIITFSEIAFKSAASQDLSPELSPLDVWGCFDRRGRSQGNSVWTLWAARAALPNHWLRRSGAGCARGPKPGCGPHGGHEHPEILTSAPRIHWDWESAGEPFIYWLHFWTKDNGLIQHVGIFFWSQGVLDEIQSGVQTHGALAGELICSHNAWALKGKKRSMQQSIFQRLLMKTGHLASLQCIC